MEYDFEEKEKLYFQNIKLTKKIDILGKEDLKELQEKYYDYFAQYLKDKIMVQKNKNNLHIKDKL